MTSNEFAEFEHIKNQEDLIAFINDVIFGGRKNTINDALKVGGAFRYGLERGFVKWGKYKEYREKLAKVFGKPIAESSMRNYTRLHQNQDIIETSETWYLKAVALGGFNFKTSKKSGIEYLLKLISLYKQFQELRRRGVGHDEAYASINEAENKRKPKPQQWEVLGLIRKGPFDSEADAVEWAKDQDHFAEWALKPIFGEEDEDEDTD